MFPFKCALVPEIPNNEGLFRPISVTAPSGSILNATFPHPVKARAKTTNNINQVLFGATWPILGDRVQAGSGSIWPFTLRGDEPGYGRFVVDMLPHGGRGALPSLDGMVPVAFPHNSVVTPCEIVEARAPVRFLGKELRADSMGAGRHQGGPGQVIAFQHVGQRGLVFSLTPDKVTCAPPGLDGGSPGECGEVRVNGIRLDRFPPIHLDPGDVVELILPGGGGFGPPAERDRRLIAADIDRRLLSPAAAVARYGGAP